MTQTSTQYSAEAHRSAFQQLLTRLMSEAVMVSVWETSPFFLSYADVSEDGDLPLRVEAGRLQAQFRGEAWLTVCDTTIARYVEYAG